MVAKTVNRAYSIVQFKSIDGDSRVIRGIATSPEPDRMGDVIEPKGAKFKNPLPLLLHHDTRLPVGNAKFSKPTDDGIEFEATFPTIDEPGTLKDRVDEAWQSVKAGLIRGVSIGFRVLDDGIELLRSGGVRFTNVEILELSLVVVPANAEASITMIKSIAEADTAALGTSQATVTTKSAGVSAPVVKASKGARTMSKTIQEQKSGFEATLLANSTRMNEIMTKASESGETLNEADSEEYDRLERENKALTVHIKRFDSLAEVNIAAATAAVGKTAETASASRGGSSVQVVTRNLPKGTGFVRYVMAMAASRGNLMQATEIAKRWKDSSPEVGLVLKAASDAGTTTDATWAAPLVVYQNMANEFIEYLRPATIIGKLNGFRRVPFNISMPRQTAGSTVNWVGQGAPKPVGELAFDTVSLGMSKVAGIIVIAEELARSSRPDAEAIISEDLRNAIVQYLDTQFVDPSVAAVTNVSPASVTNGSSVIDSTGVTAAALRTDFAAALAVWTAAGLSIAGGQVIMTESQAIRLSMIVNAFGQAEFPGLGATGGTLFGLPVVTSENIPAEGGSAAGQRIILIKPGEILMADEGGIMIDVSREASVQMNTTPDNPATASTVNISFWQNNLVGIRAERYINWLKRRTAATVIIEGAVYTG